MCCAEKKVTPRPVPVVKIAANVKNKNLIQEYTAEIDVKIKIISKVACCRIKSLAIVYNTKTLFHSSKLPGRQMKDDFLVIAALDKAVDVMSLSTGLVLRAYVDVSIYVNGYWPLHARNM